MRHAKSKYLHNRYTSWRDATLISTARNVLLHQSIRTTKIKAQASKPLIEKLISLAKTDTLAARRQANQLLNDHVLVSYLFKEIGPRFAKRSGGAVRLLNYGFRRGDGAKLAILELTEIKKKEIKKSKKAAAKKDAVTETTAEEVKEAAKDEHLHDKPTDEKAGKKFLGGIKNIFKKERDSL